MRARLVRTCGPRSFARIVKLCASYAAGTAREAELREEHSVLGPDEYRDLRRENSAVRVCLGLIEYELGIDLPNGVFENETFKRMYWAVIDMVCWANVSALSYHRLILAQES